MTISSDDFSAYIALRSKDLSLKFGTPEPTESKYFGWLLGNSSYNAAIPDAVGKTDVAANGAPAQKYFMPVRELSTGVKREYAGINSSGGPQVAGRADHEDIQIRRPIDSSSPVTFQYCCAGTQFSYVHIYMFPSADFASSIHITLADVNVTSYKIETEMYIGDNFTLGPVSTSNNSLVNQKRSEFWDNYSIKEIYTLLYTSMKIEVSGGGARGWNTGTDAPYS